jgi:CDGSH-type Zn-finger protein
MGFKFEHKGYTHAPTPKPCGCGKTSNGDGYCDGTHQQLSKDTDE